MKFQTRPTTVFTLLLLLAAAASANAQGRFLRRNKCCVQTCAPATSCCVQHCQTPSQVGCNPSTRPSMSAFAGPAAPVYAIQIQPTLYYCKGPNGECGIHGNVVVTRQAGDPAVSSVCLMVNQVCPSGTSCPGAGHYCVTIPTTSPVPTTYNVAFPADFPVGDTRIVRACSNPSSIYGCIVVKLADGTCRSFPFNNLTECVSGPMMPPCPECVFH